jgi:nucleoid DNA-binding protein
MVKSELEQKLCHMYPNMLRKDIEKIIDIIIVEIIEALCKNRAVEIRGWGRIKTIMRKSKIGRNPKNSKVVKIPEKKAIKWKMSKLMYKRLNKNFTEDKISATTNLNIV